MHGGSASEKTIQAVCSVKDFINLNDGEKNIKISKPMSTECLLSCQRWKGDLRLERDERKKKTKRKRKCEKEGQKEKKQIAQDIETIHVGIKVADKSLKAGQAQLEGLTHTNVIDKVKLIAANAQISIGMKQKSELEKELQHLNSKLQKLD